MSFRRPIRKTFYTGAAGLAAAALLSTTGLVAAAAQPISDTSADDGWKIFDEPDKSIGIYIGKDLTEAGHTLLGGFGHEPSSHWVEIVPAQEHPEGSEVVVGASEDAYMPGVLTTIPQVEQTNRYITSNYSEFTGLPTPLTNGGLNDKNVAARDIWSNSREELVDMTPEDQSGPQYSDLSRFAMERADSARDAVEILGDLIDDHGFTTYGGNSHLFADEDEGWVFIEFAGGEGLWAAERLGADEIRVSYPGYIHDFPVDAVDGDNPDYLGSDNLVSFAEEQGWYDPETDDSFNLQDVYGEPFPTDEFDSGQDAHPDDPAPYRNPVSLENEFAELDDVTLEDMMRIVRDPRWSDDRAGYGHVAELRDDLTDPSLATLWVAPTAAATSPYIPIAIGTEDLPVEFTQHRYLTAAASEDYLEPEYAEQEATEYATQTFKRLMYATCYRPEDYLTEVTAALEGYDAQSIDKWNDTIEQAQSALESGDDATDMLTSATEERALNGLRLGIYLLDDVLSQTMSGDGINVPDVEIEDGVTASARSLPMSLRGDSSSRDRMNCDMGGGWADGSSVDRAGTYGDPADIPDYSAVSIIGRSGDTDSAASSGDTGTASDDSNNVWIWAVGGLIIGILGTGAAAAATRRKNS